MKGYSTGQVAIAVGVTKTTVLNWLRQHLLAEPRRVELAGVSCRIWSEADMERARKVKATMKRGPKPKK